MRIAVVQTDPIFGDIRHNLDQAIDLMQRQPADCFVLPELFNTGYNFVSADEVRALAESADSGETARELISFAQSHRCYIAYGFAELDDGRIYNSAAIVGPDGLLGLYRKIHLFDRENLFFEKGNLGFPIFDLPIGKVGLMICFDWIYPESARTLALKGAQIILHPSNLVLPHCPDAMVTRCLENRIYTATANRVGQEDRGSVSLTYIGKSEIVSPRGVILARCSEKKSEIAIAEIDPKLSDNKRLNEHNDLLAGRRPEHYV